VANEKEVQEALVAADMDGAATAAIRWLGPDVLRYLRSVLRDEDDAAEAFSRFAEGLWRGMPAFRGDASLRTWAYRIARNTALHLRADPWRRRGTRLPSGQASSLAEEVRTRSDWRLEAQRQAVERLRARLSDAERSLLTLRVDHGLSWEAVAEVLADEGAEAQPATLRKRFERIKEKLTGLARDEGLLEG